MDNTNKQIKALAFYQMAGGIIGIAVTIWHLVNLKRFSGVLLLLIIFTFAFYAYSIFCGTLLLKNTGKGLIYSRINQLMQVGGFAMFGYAYHYVSGVYFFIGVDFTQSISLTFNFGLSTWAMHVNTSRQDSGVGLNIVALVLIIAIEKIIKRTKRAELNQQVSDIGKVEDNVSKT